MRNFAFCVFRHWLLRKAYLSLQTILTVFAGRPTKMRPLFNCSDFEELYPHVTEAYGALGYACRGEGWWLSESCRAKSPGDEYLENCIPAISTDCGRLASSSASVSLFPTVLACVSWWDVIDLRRGEDPVVVIFEWWEPDASILVNHGSAALPSEYTAIKSADWTRSDRMQARRAARCRRPASCRGPAVTSMGACDPAGAVVPQQRPHKPGNWSALAGVLRQPWHTFSRRVVQVLSSRCEFSFNWLAPAAH